MINHDDFMRDHAAKRGRVTVTGSWRSGTLTGVLVAWRPNRTRIGANGEPITRSTYTATVQPDGNPGPRQYPLNRYHVEAER